MVFQTCCRTPVSVCTETFDVKISIDSYFSDCPAVLRTVLQQKRQKKDIKYLHRGHTTGLESSVREVCGKLIL